MPLFRHLPTLAATVAGAVGAALGVEAGELARWIDAEEAQRLAAAAASALVGGGAGQLVQRWTWSADSHRDAVAAALAARADHVEELDPEVWERLGIPGPDEALQRLGLDALLDRDRDAAGPRRDPETGRFLPRDDGEDG